MYLGNRTCPLLQSVDGLQEAERSQESSGTLSLGTTKKGIGPCYASKAARQGLRMADLLAADRTTFEKRLVNIIHSHQKMFPRKYCFTVGCLFVVFIHVSR